MWHWVSSLYSKVSVTAMLREQLALEKARVSQLEEKVALLQAELQITQTELGNEKQEHQKLRQEHTEEVILWKIVEYRRGKRTFGRWRPFCPKCHLPLEVPDYSEIRCPANCGWTAHLRKKDVLEVIDGLAKMGAA